LAELVFKYELEYNDIAGFKIQTFVIKTKIYMNNISTPRLYTCPNHG
jgi:hypothetical protein